MRKKYRFRLQVVKWLITVFFIILGLFTLAAYMKLGYEHAEQKGERYIPEYLQPIKTDYIKHNQNLFISLR